MLKLEAQHNGQNLSLELPMNINMLTGELRAIGIYEPLEQIHRSEYLLSPVNELGEHFLRMVQPDDNLRSFALLCREPEALAGDSRWDAERIGPALYGCVHCELRAPLTEQEYSALTEWITHENADGYFRDFEQEPFETDFGNLYVGFWREHEDCYLLPEDEFRAQVLEQSDAGQGFGGMTC